MSAGKGSRPRPVNTKKYNENYDKIFRRKVYHRDCVNSKQNTECSAACKEVDFCIFKLS